MRSIIGRKAAYHEDESNPYIAYMYGVKKEGFQIPALFASEEDAMNGLMQSLIDSILENPNKNIIWRNFPEVLEERIYNPFEESYTIWYKAFGRWCFE